MVNSSTVVFITPSPVTNTTHAVTANSRLYASSPRKRDNNIIDAIPLFPCSRTTFFCSPINRIWFTMFDTGHGVINYYNLTVTYGINWLTTWIVQSVSIGSSGLREILAHGNSEISEDLRIILYNITSRLVQQQ